MRKTTSATLGLGIGFLAMFVLSGRAAPLGTAFNYQGRLAVNGTAANGLYDFSFALFTDAAGGTQQGSAVSLPGLTVTEGSFTVALDFGSVFDGNGRWLAISVRTNGAASFTDLTPRQPVMPTPYALYAMTAPAGTVANNSITSAQLASDPASLGKVTGGNVTLDSNGDMWPLAIFLNSSHDLYLRNDLNHGLGWYGAGRTFAGAAPDGPVLYGYSGGALGTEQGGTENIALSWTPTGAVGIGKTSPSSALDVNGTVTATAFVGNGAGLTGLPAPTVANNSITSAQLATDPASLGKMTGGLSSDSNGDTFLNNHNLFLRTDDNHGVGWFGAGKTFAGASPDGPVLFGYSGGMLGTERYGTETIALSWTTNGAVGIGKTSPSTALDVNGTVTATAFVGNGAGLTGLPAATVANNSITDAQLASTTASLGKMTGGKMIETSGGNVGLGTTTPGTLLQIAGSQYVSAAQDGLLDIGPDGVHGSVYLTLDGENVQARNSPGTGQPLYLNWYGGDVDIGEGTLHAAFHGNVGIGKANPGTALDVNGTVTATAFVGNGAGLTGLPAPTVANNSITSAQLATDPASLGKMTGGMSSDSNGDTFLNNHNLFLRSNDDNHGVGWFGAGKTFAGASPDGPVLFGYSGGALGTEQFGTENIALSWTPSGNVGIGTTTPGTLLQTTGSPFISGSHDGLVNIGPDGGHGSTYLTFDAASIQARSSPSSGQPLYLNWYGGDVDVGDHTLHAYFNGGVTVGTTASPGSYKLYVGGNAYCTGSWSGSDARWKKNVQPVTQALEKVTHLQGVTYDWRRDEFPERNFDEGTQLGFLAQEVEKVVPEAVRTDAEGYKAVAYEKLTAVLTEGVKEQQTEIESLKARNAALEKDVTELKALVNKLLAK